MTPDRAALMHRLTYHAAGLSDRALQLLVLMAGVLEQLRLTREQHCARVSNHARH